MAVVSKFVIGSDQGISDLFEIEESSLTNLYKKDISEEIIKNYTEETLNSREAINGLNNLSNQLIITYQDEIPVAYALLKGGLKHPSLSIDKRVTKIEFAIKPEYDSSEVKDSLWEKTINASKFTDILWTNILVHDSLLFFLKEKNFSIVEKSQSEPFNLPSEILSLEV